MKAGDLVSYKGEIGIVLKLCSKRWAKPDDVLVLWPDEKVMVESGEFLVVVNANR